VTCIRISTMSNDAYCGRDSSQRPQPLLRVSRQTSFKGGAGTGGVYINGRVCVYAWLRPTLDQFHGQASGPGAVPDWMHDFHGQSGPGGANANYIRWIARHAPGRWQTMRSG